MLYLVLFLVLSRVYAASRNEIYHPDHHPESFCPLENNVFCSGENCAAGLKCSYISCTAEVESCSGFTICPTDHSISCTQLVGLSCKGRDGVFSICITKSIEYTSNLELSDGNVEDDNSGRYPGFHNGKKKTKKPSLKNTLQPSSRPSRQPTRQPTGRPTGQPTDQPTGHPSRQPIRRPTGQPTGQPIGQPTNQPTGQPSRQPTGQPYRPPTSQPMGQPTAQPTRQPTAQASQHLSGQPTGQPTRQPTGQPSRQPTGPSTINRQVNR